MKLKVGHATQLPPPPLTSEEDAAAEGGTEGGREAISDIFDFHHPRSLLWRGERSKGLSYFIVVDGRPFVPPT